MNPWFMMFLIAGLMLIGAEIFVPGGVLGVIGVIALIAAAVMGFSIFSPATAMMITFGMMIMVGVVILLWIKIFPHTGIGRQMTLMRNLKGAKGTDNAMESLIGKIGITRSELRPAGIIEVEHRRLDVITQGEMIDPNVTVRVKAIKGNHIIVEALSPSV